MLHCRSNEAEYTTKERSLEFQTGLVSVVTLEWSRSHRTSINATRTVDLNSLLTPQPMVLKRRVQCVINAGDIPIQTLVFHSSLGSLVSNVAASVTVDAIVQTRTETGGQTTVILQQPQTGKVAATFEVVQQLSDDVETVAPIRVESSDSVLNVISHVAAVIDPPGFSAELFAGPATNSIAEDDGRARFASLVEDRLPSRFLNIMPAASIELRLTPLVAQRQIIGEQHSVLVFERYLDWTMTAELRIDTVPVFRHVIQLDDRFEDEHVEIEEVTVESNGANRLARWRRDGSRLTLFLNGRPTQPQTITLQARIPRGSELETRLPTVAFEDSTPIASRWSVEC